MNKITERSAAWIYKGIWRFLVECFRVPDGPPELPDGDDGLRVFHPSRRYLSYLKFYFWIALVAIDLAILCGWILLYVQFPNIAWVTAFPALVIAIAPDVVAYIAIHLRYDTIWYGVSNRGVYIRRGIVVIVEHSITLENVQNVVVHRGPIEQIFGLSSITIETAGAAAGGEQDDLVVGNKAIMVGLEQADEIRELVMKRVKQSRSAGLGDDLDYASPPPWHADDLETLTQILHEVKQLH